MKKEGIKSYYQAKIEDCELVLNEKSQDLRRLEAQRNSLNAKGFFLKKKKLLPIIRILIFSFYLCLR